MKNKWLIKKVKVKIIKGDLIQPFRTALGSHDIFENIFFVVELNDGTKGYGEAAVAGHITGETVKETFKNLTIAGEDLVGCDIRDYLNISYKLNERLVDNKSAVAAIETALMDALTREWKIPLWKFFGNTISPLITDITIVLSNLKETENAIRKFYRQGFRIFKVKIGQDFDLDLKRIQVIKRLAPKSEIYLDANQGYDADTTLKFLKELKNIRIKPALLEQPVPRGDWEGLKKVSRMTSIPVCADESVRSIKEVIFAIQKKAASVINIKLMKFGLIQAREIAFICRSKEVDLMIGGMLESSLAMTASAHLAAGLGCFRYVDLDTPFFIKNELEHNPYLNRRGVYNLKSAKAGIGIKIDKI